MNKDFNILVVDDNEDLARNIQDILHEKGYRTAMAKDSVGAMKKCEQETFDLVLLDYNLPDLDGLRTQDRLSAVTRADFIIITGYASVESAAAAVSRKQIVGYETKPLNMDRLLSFIQQIRERRRMEKELRKSQARYKNLYEAVMDALFVHGLEEDGSLGKFTEVNDIACQRYGYSREELLRMSPLDLIDPDSKVDTGALVEKLKKGGGVTFEQPHRTKNAQVIPAEVHAKAFQLDGKPSVISLVRDITERKKADEKRRLMEQRIQVLQRLESLGVMAGGIAHDFNNILMTIIGNIEMAMDDTGQSPVTLENLEESKNASLRAADLVKQMLAYSGKGHFVVEPVRMNPIVEETARLAKNAMSPKTVLETRLDGENPMIEGDKSQFRQIVMNLISNACESLNENGDGSVTVSTGVTTCDARRLKETVPEAWLGYEEPLKEGRYAFLEVKDTGCGMNADTQKRIFEPFFTTKFQGRGLGLSSVIGIVRGHHGFVRVDSQPGRGALIRVLFPLLEDGETPAREAAPPEPDSEWRGKGLILVVDDEDSVRRLIRLMLGKVGYDTILAANGKEAVDLYRKHSEKIDLILMDLSMPVMNGVEAFQKLRDMECKIPVILASGYSEEQISHKYAGKGFSGFIQKPFLKQTLIQMLAQAFGDGRP